MSPDAVTAKVLAAAALLPKPKSGWEAVELVLSRSVHSYGFTVSLQGLVEAVVQRGSAAVAGLEQGDVIVGVIKLHLQHYQWFASHLSGRQREGTRLKLTVHRCCQASDPNKQQCRACHQPGMQAFTGVCLSDGHKHMLSVLRPHL